MILYLSGNFPQLSKIEKEQAMAEHLEKNSEGYHRLVTFYYKKDCKTVLKIVKTINKKKKKTLLHKKEKK